MELTAGPGYPGLTHHYYAVVYSPSAYATPNDIICLDMDDETIHVTEGPIGRMTMPQVSPVNGLLYYGSNHGYADPNYACSYNFLTKEHVEEVALPTFYSLGVEYYQRIGILICSNETLSRVFIANSEADDGSLFAWTERVGETPGSLESFGILDDPGGSCDFTADAGTDQLSVSEVYLNGRHVRFSTTGTLPAPLAINTDYYLHYIDDTHVTVATTRAKALIGTDIIDITNTGTGTHTILPHYQRDITSMQVNNGYAYCAVRDQGENSLRSLCFVDLATKAQTPFWKDGGGFGTLKFTGVYRKPTSPYTVYVAYNLTGKTTDNVYYTVNGPDTPVLADPQPTGLIYQTNFPYNPLLGLYAIDGSLRYTGMYSDDPEDKRVRLGYTYNGGAPVFKEAEVSDLSEYSVQRGGLDLDNNLITHPTDYAPTAKYNHATGAVTIIPNQNSAELYAVGPDPYRNVMWFGGYPHGNFYKYDPAVEFGATNPLKIAFDNEGWPLDAERFYQIERMVDKSIWVMGNYTRTLENGEIMRYIPETPTDFRVEGAFMEDHLLFNMAPNAARSTMVVNAGQIASQEHYLFVIQALRQANEKDSYHGFTKVIKMPPPGGTLLPANTKWTCTSVETGASDINRFVCLQVSATPYQAFCIDIATGQYIWRTEDISGSSYVTPYSKLPFAYGHVWYFNSLNLMKMNALTGVESNAKIGGVNIAISGGSASQLRGLVWDTVNKILYMWDTYNKQTYRIEGIDGI